MKIFVKVKTGAREDKVIPPLLRLSLQLGAEASKEWYTVSVKEPPIDGRANDAILHLLAEYFEVPRSSVRLISGATSKKKTFEIK